MARLKNPHLAHRRSAVLLCACAVAGFIIDFGTAWVYAILIDYPVSLTSELSFEGRFEDGSTWTVRRFDLRTKEVVSFECVSWSGHLSATEWSTLGSDLDCDAADVFRAVGLEGGDYRLFMETCGWPFYSWRSLYLSPGVDPIHIWVGRGIETQWYHEGVLYGAKKSLPYDPIWSMVVLNSLFYAAIVAAIYLGGCGVRRYLRCRQGRCRRCGYDLRAMAANGCPECGWNRPPNEGQRPSDPPPLSAEASSTPTSEVRLTQSSASPPPSAPSPPSARPESTGSGHTPASS